MAYIELRDSKGNVCGKQRCVVAGRFGLFTDCWGEWNVTHLQTGWRADGADGRIARMDKRSLIKALNKLDDALWDFTTLTQFKRRRRRIKADATRVLDAMGIV